jgi:hypothetical protein
MLDWMKEKIKKIVRFMLGALAVLGGVVILVIIISLIPGDPCEIGDATLTDPDVIAECKARNAKLDAEIKVKAARQAERDKANVERNLADAVEDERRSKQIRWIAMETKTERLLKKNLKDPDSYQNINTYYLEENGETKVTIEYRARNGFGGMTVDTYSRVFK